MRTTTEQTINSILQKFGFHSIDIIGTDKIVQMFDKFMIAQIYSNYFTILIQSEYDNYKFFPHRTFENYQNCIDYVCIIFTKNKSFITN